MYCHKTVKGVSALGLINCEVFAIWESKFTETFHKQTLNPDNTHLHLWKLYTLEHNTIEF